MKRAALLLCFLVPLPVLAKTHKDVYNTPCSSLWPAVKDVLKTSGKYNIIGIDSTEMTASFTVGSVWTGKLLNSVVLMPQGAGCEMSVNTAYRGIEHNDAGDFKKRVDEAFAKTKPASEPVPLAKGAQ